MAPVRNTVFFMKNVFIYLSSFQKKTEHEHEIHNPDFIFVSFHFLATTAPQSTMPFISHIYPNTLCKPTRKLVLTNHLLFPRQGGKKKHLPVRTCWSETGPAETWWLRCFLLSYHWNEFSVAYDSAMPGHVWSACWNYRGLGRSDMFTCSCSRSNVRL